MPLFNVEVKVSKSILIPVYAKTLEEAEQYMKDEDDWKQDGSLDYESGDMAVGKIEKVESPEKCEWEEDINCWNPYCQDISAAEAFFDVELDLPEEADEDDELCHRRLTEWREAKAEAIQSYAKRHRGVK